ncbi:YbfB/YjiJ family MFS transporter [Roseibium sp. M-1]
MSRRVTDQLKIVLAGSASLAITMGVGRFGFTSILPMMLHHGTVDLAFAGRLATANYVGYVVGSLAAMLIPKAWSQTDDIKSALYLTIVLTALMAIPLPSTWIGLRFLVGVASAIGFAITSGWCLVELSAAPGSIGGAIFTGPGAGIAISGLAASVTTALSFTRHWGWTAFAVLSAGMSALIWRAFRKSSRDVEPFYFGSARTSSRVLRTEMPMFAVAYGFAGFGYIVTATYLPVVAKKAIPDSPLLTVFWPLFGISAVAGSLLASRGRKSADARLCLVGSYLVQSTGVAMPVVWEDALDLALCSILVGVPFTAITHFALNQVGRVRSSHHAR